MKWHRKPGKENLFRCTYVLPDGVTHTKGFVKYPDQANRYLTLTDGASPAQAQMKENTNHPEFIENPEDRKRVDLTKNVVWTLFF